MNEAALNRKAVKRIMVVLTIGILLLLFDFFVGFDFSTLKLMNSGSNTYLVRPVEGSSAGHISLKADIETEKGTVTKDYELSLYPYARENSSRNGGASGGGTSGSGKSGGAAGSSSGGASSGSASGDSTSGGGTSGGATDSNSSGSTAGIAGSMSEEELLAYEMRSVINSLNDDQSAKRVILPDHLRTGEKITWTAAKRTNTAAIAFAMIVLAVFIYRNRLEPLEKVRQVRMDSVRRQLPEFVNRLVLLLGAGLVLSSAFERIVEESRQSAALAGDYFYGCMDGIYSKIKETNGSMEREFRDFARSSEHSGEGSRELMRISNIITDNISKGVELTDKLQSESETLWLSRKRSSEERGRLAETKLTMPLTVFVLVVVTVSPALLEL